MKIAFQCKFDIIYVLVNIFVKHVEICSLNEIFTILNYNIFKYFNIYFFYKYTTLAIDFISCFILKHWFISYVTYRILRTFFVPAFLLSQFWIDLLWDLKDKVVTRTRFIKDTYICCPCYYKNYINWYSVYSDQMSRND